jgi:hypothetical protein
VFPSRSLLLGVRASSWNADLYLKDAVTARPPKCAFLAASNIRYAPRYRSLICYRYRCELGWIRLISRRIQDTVSIPQGLVSVPHHHFLLRPFLIAA